MIENRSTCHVIWVEARLREVIVLNIGCKKCQILIANVNGLNFGKSHMPVQGSNGRTYSDMTIIDYIFIVGY